LAVIFINRAYFKGTGMGFTDLSKDGCKRGESMWPAFAIIAPRGNIIGCAFFYKAVKCAQILALFKSGMVKNVMCRVNLANGSKEVIK
jgi:hypothetical protein